MKNRILVLTLAAILAGLGVGGWLLWGGADSDRPYHRIEDGLYLGSSIEGPPPGTRAVLNLCGREDSYKVEASLWEPVLESGTEPPNVAWLRRVVEFVAQQRRVRRPTYVHCMAGINRSAAVVAAYLMREHGWSRDRALAQVRERRPVIQPDPTMMQLLKEWESVLTAPPAADR